MGDVEIVHVNCKLFLDFHSYLFVENEDFYNSNNNKWIYISIKHIPDEEDFHKFISIGNLNRLKIRAKKNMKIYEPKKSKKKYCKFYFSL